MTTAAARPPRVDDEATFGPAEYAQALLNILEDFGAEKLHLEDTQRAVLNILDDLGVEKENLQRTQTNLVASEHEIRLSLREKEVLLQEVHHRVKNNLQVISSLINMQARRLDPGIAREALEECKTRVQAIALIHETLYQSKDYSRVAFAEYARNLVANVFLATGVSPAAVSLEMEMGNVTLAVDRAIPCGLILNELITNALKHAFPEGRRGTVHVGLTQAADGCVTMNVRDDGVGIAGAVAVGQSGTLGMQLVRTLAEQLDATFEVTPYPTLDHRRGASFTLAFQGG